MKILNIKINFQIAPKIATFITNFSELLNSPDFVGTLFFKSEQDGISQYLFSTLLKKKLRVVKKIFRHQS